MTSSPSGDSPRGRLAFFTITNMFVANKFVANAFAKCDAGHIARAYAFRHANDACPHDVGLDARTRVPSAQRASGPGLTQR